MDKTIVSRKADFWLLGGASILVWTLLESFFPTREKSAEYSFQIGLLSILVSFLTVLANQPHFISSYIIGYSQSKKFVLNYWFSLIVVPVALTVFFSLAYFLYESIGKGMMGFSVLFMNITIGWHYSKQVYGCMMVYSKYDKYEISNRLKLAIRYNLLAIGLLNFVFLCSHYSSVGAEFRKFLGIDVIIVNFPSGVSALLNVFISSTFSYIVYSFYRTYRKSKTLPSVNFIIPLFAFYLWWHPSFHQQEFYFLMVPFFHSIQYLPFAQKRLNFSSNKPRKRLLLWIVLGIIAFQLVPKGLDIIMDTEKNTGIIFFLAAIGLSINIHHYFIDSVIWRFKGDEMKKTILD